MRARVRVRSRVMVRARVRVRARLRVRARVRVRTMVRVRVRARVKVRVKASMRVRVSFVLESGAGALAQRSVPLTYLGPLESHIHPFGGCLCMVTVRAYVRQMHGRRPSAMR